MVARPPGSLGPYLEEQENLESTLKVGITGVAIWLTGVKGVLATSFRPFK